MSQPPADAVELASRAERARILAHELARAEQLIGCSAMPEWRSEAARRAVGALDEVRADLSRLVRMLEDAADGYLAARPREDGSGLWLTR